MKPYPDFDPVLFDFGILVRTDLPVASSFRRGPTIKTKYSVGQVYEFGAEKFQGTTRRRLLCRPIVPYTDYPANQR
jgi:hypothetical protein